MSWDRGLTPVPQNQSFPKISLVYTLVLTSSRHESYRLAMIVSDIDLNSFRFFIMRLPKKVVSGGRVGS